MGQGGERFIVTKDPKDVDRWRQLVRVAKVEEPSYGGSKELKLLNSIKVCHMKVDDPNMDFNVKESEESLSFYYARNISLNTIETEKVLYVYLKGLQTMKLTPIFLDKFGIAYEPMEQKIVKGMTWQELPILELAPKFALSIEGEHERSSLSGMLRSDVIA